MTSRPMIARDRTEAHRASTPLEAFFDLCFVVAVSQAASALHKAYDGGNLTGGFGRYFMTFFAIWWAWMNFTWFASSYDTDDIPYRLATFVQIVGVLILAAGVPRAFNDFNFSVVTLGYFVMRASLAGQWIRVARAHPSQSAVGYRYAVGISGCMIGWGAILVIPHTYGRPLFLIMVILELLTPVWAEKKAIASWHPEHISERYSLFFLFVLGESVLATSVAIQAANDSHLRILTLLSIASGGILIVLSMWWIYFFRPGHEEIETGRVAFIWGYGHYFIFAATAAVGAGLSTAVDYARSGKLPHGFGPTETHAAVTIPTAAFILGIWALHAVTVGLKPRGHLLLPAAALLILLTTPLSQAYLLTGLIMAGMVTAKVIEGQRNSP